MDYSAYWGMSASPFADGAKTTTSPLLDEAIARLSFLVDERRPLGILVGDAGTARNRRVRKIIKEPHEFPSPMTLRRLFWMAVQAAIIFAVRSGPRQGRCASPSWRRDYILLLAAQHDPQGAVR